MSTYAIGDLQGCYEELLELLEHIRFNETDDQLWFTGDIVNRGPASLKTLRLVKKLNAIIILGNHDLHLLAIAAGKGKLRKTDTLDTVLNAEDKEELLNWLQRQPLLYQDTDLGYTMIHAGLAPQWSIADAKTYAMEVESVLQGKNAEAYFANMYGDQPDQWSDDLRDWERLRFITNCLTRLRYCDNNGRLAIKEKGAPGNQPSQYLPWYQVDKRNNKNEKIIFGHWATIRLGEKQNFESYNVYPMDTGCVWGGKLTAMRLEDEKFFSVPSKQKNSPYD